MVLCLATSPLYVSRLLLFMQKHVLYKTGDKGCPDQILDSNGEVVLGMCKICGLAESELDNSHCIVQTKTFETGAVRSTDADGVRFDLITPIGLRRLAETYNEGAKKYGSYNWLKGFPASDLSNHVIQHIYKWLNGDTSEDHLAHAAWGLFTIMHFQETRPELIDIPAIKNEVSQETTKPECEKPDGIYKG